MSDTPETEQTEMTAEGYEAAMRNQFLRTWDSYDTLVDQCYQLADVMGYSEDYVLGQVMPKKAGDRAKSGRIKQWFDAEVTTAVSYRLEADAKRRETEAKLLAAIKQWRTHLALVKRLQLTPEQLELLRSDLRAPILTPEQRQSLQADEGPIDDEQGADAPKSNQIKP